MPESKRQCSTCKYFQNAQLSGNGWCTHPKRQVASDVKILVRERELACRNTWGDDLWIDASSNATTPQPPPAPRRQITYLNTKLDDEVTSVVDSGSLTRDTRSNQDDVVTFTSVRPDETPAKPAEPAYDVNAGAVADQEERARLIHKGSRHAIDSARKRHSQRWAPAKADDEIAHGDSVEPASAITEDQVLNAGPRVTQPEQDAILDNRHDLATGPVPRAEIEAHGALPPLPDAEPTEARPAPTVSTSVDLPRLRSFLKQDDEQANASEPAPARPEPTSNFEHVIRQAERIKALSKSERAAQTRGTPAPVRRTQIAPAPAPVPDPVIESEPAATSTSQKDEVVWDLADGELNMTFARARAAIDHRVAPETPAEEPEQPWVEPVVETPVEDMAPAEFAALAPLDDEIVEPAFQPLPMEVSEPEFMIEAEASHDQDLIVDELDPIDSWEYEDAWEEEAPVQLLDDVSERAVAQPPAPARRESPRTSWWRSLNFSIRRRYQPDPEPVYEYEPYEDSQYEATREEATEPIYDTAEAYEYDQYSDTAYSASSPDYVEYGYLDDFSDDHLDQPIPYWDDASVEPVTEQPWLTEDVVEDEVVHEELPLAATRDSRVTPLTTSEENWQLDSREFPEPQPVAWHQSRAELLARRPEPEPDRAVRPVRQEPVDEVEWIEPQAATRRQERPQPRRSRPEPREFIPIDKPSGMDAFRNALFGGTPTAATVFEEQWAEPAPAPTSIHEYEARERRTEPRYVEPGQVIETYEPEVWDEPEYEPVVAQRRQPQRNYQRDDRWNRPRRSSRSERRDDEDVFDIRRAIADPDDTTVTRQLDMENGVAKCCLTCRSFQPGDGAGRGWCMNEWASTYRQMVNADTLACKSSIGNWWIAADTSWIPPSDSIQPQTPRADRLVARAESREDRDTSKRSRVRTGKVG